MTAMPRYRDARVGGCLSTLIEDRADGCRILRSPEPLGPYRPRLIDYLEHWAREAGERVLVAQRSGRCRWRRVTYRQMLDDVRRLAGHLLAFDLSAERPVAILSGNSIEHLTVALAAAWIGVPHAPISPPYSLISRDFGKLRHVIDKLTPGLVFVQDAAPFLPAITAAVPSRTTLLTAAGRVPGRPCAGLADWLAKDDSPDWREPVERASAAVTGSTILKFLFTSGSTRMPKAVTTTHQMLCANQQMLRQSLKFLADEPPVLVDWLPWSHTFGGSHNVGIVLTNGGSLYIDAGNPTPGGMQTSLANLREISPTIYFNVPKGFEELALALQNDGALAESLFSRARCFFFAGAGLSQPVWDQIDRLSEQTVGERIPIITGLGMTETSPTSTLAVRPRLRAGQIGLPCPGVEAKLAPVGDKVEIRFRGPHVMPGYWREADLSAEAFDAEGFYRTGDAVTFADGSDLQQGLMFDGRIAEDFKLSTGSFVSVGPLRTRAIMAGAPVIQDVVITGLNRDDVGMLVFARLEACAAIAGLQTGDDADTREALAVLSHPRVTGWLQDLVDRLHRAGTGSANRITRAMWQVDPLSIDLGEVTDKGSINQRAVLQHRAVLVDLLHGGAGADADRPDLTRLIVRADRDG